jgi:ATP-dependent helicase/nuclease subunit B
VLAHGALAHFWRGLRTQQALVAAGDDGRARRAAAAVTAALADYRGYLPGGRLRALESRWLERAVLALADCELSRTPFEVLDVERDETISLGGHPLRVRLDRLDRVDSAETIVIDYKTGHGKPHRWAGPRPDALQLAVYAAFRAEPPQAVAIARLPLALNDHKKFYGVAAREGLLPDVRAIARASQPALRGRTWSDLLAEWHAVAARLGTEFAAGVATVDPTPEACAYCALSSLCRIDERTLITAAAEPDGGAARGGAQAA